MWFKKFLLGLAAILLGLTGIVFVGLFLFCLGLYLLWNSLGLGIVFFGLTGLVSLLLARMAMRIVPPKGKSKFSAKQKAELAGLEAGDLPELDWVYLGEQRTIGGRREASRHKIK